MMGILDTLQRIPSEYVAVLVSVIAAWIYLRFEQNDSTRAVLSEMAFEFLFSYIIIARLSGLFLHPRELADISIWTLLAQAPSEGWVFGLLGSTAILLWRLRRQNKLNWADLRTTTNAALFGIASWWLVRTFIDHGPFMRRTIGMLVITVVLLLFSLRKRGTPAKVHRLWIVMVVSLLLTSTWLPKINQLAVFTPVQWFSVLILFAGLGIELVLDIRKQQDLHRHALPDRKV